MDRRPLALLLVAFAAGCGGRGAARPAARLAVRMAWPARRARVIPSNTASLRITVAQGGATLASALVVSPATTASFVDLPEGTVSVTATAYPFADGSGAALATATVPSTVAMGSTQNVSLTMASTVARITLAPNPVDLSLNGIFSRQLVLTAFDAGNNVVLTSPTDYAYTSTNSLLFNVSASGVVTGLVVGTGTVTATHRDSGLAATSTVRVTL